jgi:hypothetical protein
VVRIAHTYHETFEKPGDFQNSTLFTINHKATRYTKQGLPLRRNSVCPAFNPDYAVDTYCGLKNLAATLVTMPAA